MYHVKSLHILIYWFNDVKYMTPTNFTASAIQRQRYVHHSLRDKSVVVDACLQRPSITVSLIFLLREILIFPLFLVSITHTGFLLLVFPLFKILRLMLLCLPSFCSRLYHCPMKKSAMSQQLHMLSGQLAQKPNCTKQLDGLLSGTITVWRIWPGCLAPEWLEKAFIVTGVVPVSSSLLS